MLSSVSFSSAHSRSNGMCTHPLRVFSSFLSLCSVCAMLTVYTFFGLTIAQCVRKCLNVFRLCDARHNIHRIFEFRLFISAHIVVCAEYFSLRGKKPKTNWKPNQVGKKHWKIAKVIGEAHIFFFATENDTEKLTNMSTQTRNGTNAIRFSEKSWAKKRGCEWTDKRQPKYGCQFGVNLLRKWSGFRLWVPCMIRHCMTETCTNRSSMWLFYWHQFSMYSQ